MIIFLMIESQYIDKISGEIQRLQLRFQGFSVRSMGFQTQSYMEPVV